MSKAGDLSLRFVPLSEVVAHERVDARRVERLTAALKGDGILRHPPIVSRANSCYVVLDGATRTQALRNLGYCDGLVQVVDASMTGFRLSTWHHLVQEVSGSSILEATNHLADVHLQILDQEQASAQLAQRELNCYLAVKGIGFFGVQSHSALGQDIATLNRVFDAYAEHGEIIRVATAQLDAALDDHPAAEVLVVFPQFLPEEILDLAEMGHRLPPGITRYIIPGRTLGINTDLSLLGPEHPLAAKNEILDAFASECVRQGKVRLYEEPVLVIEEGNLKMQSVNNKPSRVEILLGNGAIARGIVESGCQMMTAYPGTPSTEILAEVSRFKRNEDLDLYVEWSVNEKVALETALAGSLAGQRTAVAMKQVGLNVASDPLLSAAYTGVAGGLVVVACDDPGPHSSQTEQDTRLFALFAKVPVLDPATPREAKEMVGAAFELSETFQMPVLLRPTTRVCHATQNISLGDVPPRNGQTRFKKDPARWAATPRFRYLLHKELNEKLQKIEEAFEQSPFNRVIGPDGELALGIITSGACATLVEEVLADTGMSDRVGVLRIGTPFPLPQKLVAEFVARCERVLVLEEPDYAIEMQIRDKSKVSGRLDNSVPSAGELTPEVVYGLLVDAANQAGVTELAASADGELQAILGGLELPVRKPRLCPGCPHRSAFFAIKRTFPKSILPSDIGCYTLGINLRAVDTVIDMGASITMAGGFYRAQRMEGDDKPVVATIGDSTFLHSGVPGLANAVHNGARFILVILDNGTTAMTGMQPTAQTPGLAYGTTDKLLSIERLVLACGVTFVREIDPYDFEAMESSLKEAETHIRADDGGVAVLIAKRACVLYDRSAVRENPVRVEVTQECDGCKYCLVAFECPALVLGPTGDRVEIDRRICIDCGECIEGCYKGFIVPQPQLESNVAFSPAN